MNNKIGKAIIPVAGLGTRFLPATKAQPKEMLLIVEKLSIEEAPSNTAILGRYIVTTKVFDILSKTKLGKGNSTY